jgi:protein-disulfide isomerase
MLDKLRLFSFAVLATLLLTGGVMAAPKPGFEIKPADRTLGNPKAKVVLIEYAAFSCPICAAFSKEVMPQIKANYIDKGKVFYVFRLFPRMPEDGIAEKLARCLPKEKYFGMADVFFANQKAWDPEFGVHDGPAQLGKLALQAGMKKDQINACAADPADNDRINQVAQEAVERYGLTGTPTLVINGTAQPSGSMDYTDLAKLLDKTAPTRR